MKKVFKRKAMYVSYDGKEFDTKGQCQKYEREHPEPQPSLLERRVKELEEVEHRISCYKSLHWEFYEDKEYFTWYCGREHQKALKNLEEAKKSTCLSRLDRLVSIGEAARQVINWKMAEKKAYEQLMKLRLRRNTLRAEIEGLKESAEKGKGE